MRRFALALTAACAVCGCNKAPWAPPPLQKFVMKMESRYRRDEDRNAVALHFIFREPQTMVVQISHLPSVDSQMLRTVSESAYELAVRLAAEEKDIDQSVLKIEIEVKPREK